MSLEEHLWGQLRRNGYRKRKEKRIERRGRRRETKGGKKIVWADKHGKIYRKVKSNNEKGRYKDVQKRMKKTRT